MLSHDFAVDVFVDVSRNVDCRSVKCSFPLHLLSAGSRESSYLSAFKAVTNQGTRPATKDACRLCGDSIRLQRQGRWFSARIGSFCRCLSAETTRPLRAGSASRFLARPERPERSARSNGLRNSPRDRKRSSSKSIRVFGHQMPGRSAVFVGTCWPYHSDTVGCLLKVSP
jgi:hypothetical protein